jgi:glycosyltransferase involved in cell wall biosynthesis
MRGAALFAAPSHQENFGIAAVEAMACGVPILISPHVNIANDVLAAGAGWVSEVNRRELAATLATAMRDVAERAKRGRAAREIARKCFSWDSVSTQLIRLYETVANSKP